MESWCVVPGLHSLYKVLFLDIELVESISIETLPSEFRKSSRVPL